MPCGDWRSCKWPGAGWSLQPTSPMWAEGVRVYPGPPYSLTETLQGYPQHANSPWPRREAEQSSGTTAAELQSLILPQGLWGTSTWLWLAMERRSLERAASPVHGLGCPHPWPLHLSIPPPSAGGWVGAAPPRGLVPPAPSHAPIYGLATLTCHLLPFCRTLNNNNITSIPVSSFNHMPKLRTL